MAKYWLTIVIFILIKTNVYSQKTENYQNKQTQSFCKMLHQTSSDGIIMFGIANGLDFLYSKPLCSDNSTSDCKKITGKNPLFVENDFLFSSEKKFWNNELELTKKAALEQGIAIGYCWHLRGMNSKSFYNNREDTFLAKKILIDGSVEQKWFINLIDTLLTPTFKKLGFPIIFRPFHEMNGNWFWWGKNNISPQEYIKLYRLTVDRLRKNEVNNLLYAWSPDTRFDTAYYPGDNYVDVCGLDAYEPGCSPYHGNKIFATEFEKLIEFTKNHKKLSAICETGLREYNGVWRYPMEIPQFWTQKVIGQITNQDNKSKGIAYVMSWYNADWNKDNKGSLYYPHPKIKQQFGKKGKEAIKDFKKLKKMKNVYFQGEGIKFYQQE